MEKIKDIGTLRHIQDIDFNKLISQIVSDLSVFGVIASILLLTVFIIFVIGLINKAMSESCIEDLRWNKVANHTVLWDKYGSGKIIPLAADEILVGRHASSDIRFTDMSVSRYHACLTVQNGVWSVIDLDSKTGTYVNGRKVSKAVLKFNDVLQFGNVKVIIKKIREDI